MDRAVSKAVAGAVATALVAYLNRHGLVIGADVSDALGVIFAAVIGFVVVYVAPRNSTTAK